MNYQDLLKSETELTQESELKKQSETEEQLKQEDRLRWLSLSQTSIQINQVRVIVQIKLDEISSASGNSEISDNQLRLSLVEVETLKKVINLLTYGRYSTSNNSTTSSK